MIPFIGFQDFNPNQHLPPLELSASNKAALELNEILKNLENLSLKDPDEINYREIAFELVKLKELLEENKIEEEDQLYESIDNIINLLFEMNELIFLFERDLKWVSLDLLSSLFTSLTQCEDKFYPSYFKLLSCITNVNFCIDSESELSIYFFKETNNISLNDITSFMRNGSIGKIFTIFFGLKISAEEIQFFEEFLFYYREHIESLIIDYPVHDKWVDAVLYACKNLVNLSIVSKNFEAKNLKNLHTLHALKRLTLTCENLISLSIPLPPSLDEIRLIHCSKLEKLPLSIILPSLNKFVIHNCKNLSMDYKIDYVSSLFKTNLKQGLAFINDFGIDDHQKLGNALIDSISFEQIKLHVDLIKKCVPQPALCQIMVNILNNDLHFFLNHAQGFPLLNLPDAILKEIPSWVKFNQYKINLLKFKEIEIGPSKSESIEELQEVKKEETKKVSLNELLSLFEAINFENDQEAGFISEKYLTIDGERATKEQIRNGLEKIILNVKNLANYTAVPKELDERNIWYRELKKDLQTIIILSKQSSNKEVYSQELIRLGAAGHNCGTRWKKESKDVISVLKNIPYEFKGISDSLEHWLISYFEGVATEISFQFKDQIEDIMQPHLFNTICKIMKEMNLPLNETFIIDLKDTYITSFSTQECNEIKEKIHEYLMPIRIAHFIQLKIAELLTENEFAGEMILNAFKELAEKELSSQIIRLESPFEERTLICGLKTTQTLLHESLIKKAISENNEVEINKYKLANRMNFMRISQNLKKEMFELKEKEIVNLKKRKAEAPLEEGVLRGEKKPKVENTKDELNLNETILQYQNYITNPKDFEKELKELGHASAAKEMRMEREAMVTEYLEENKLTEVDLIGNVKPTLEGILALLKSFNYLLIFEETKDSVSVI